MQKEIGDAEQHMILTFCGMAEKILIAELSQLYPEGIFLDIESAVDYLCVKYDTRGWKYQYHDLINIFAELLPDVWNDS